MTVSRHFSSLLHRPCYAASEGVPLPPSC